MRICSKCGNQFVWFEFRSSSGYCPGCESGRNVELLNIKEPRRGEVKNPQKAVYVPTDMRILMGIPARTKVPT